MSAAAVLRSAGAACRALRPTAARFRRRNLDAKKEQPFSPRDHQTIITPRRHYGGGGVNTMEEVIDIGALVSSPYSISGFFTDLNRHAAKELAATDRISMKLDEATNSFDTHHILLKYLLEEKIKYERLKRVLVRVPIFGGIAYCVNKHFSGGSGDEEAKDMNGSH